MVTSLLAPQWASYIVLGVLFVLLIVAMVIMNRRNKKREKEAEAKLDSVDVGNKVKTIGGICGIVVEVDREEGTFVLETGSETSGKCFIKFIKEAIYDSDAFAEASANKPAEAVTENTEKNPEATEPVAEENAAEEAQEKPEKEAEDKE